MQGINWSRPVVQAIGMASLSTCLWSQSTAELFASTPASSPSASHTTVATLDGTPATAPSSPTVGASSPRAMPKANYVPAEVLPHTWQQNRLAVTIRVNQIPVITFLGTQDELDRLVQEQTLTEAGNTLQRAQTVIDQINQFAQQPNFDPSQIQLAFNAESRSYQITVGETPLITIDGTMTLPERTLAPDQTALQTANRLRRLLGGAEPLTHAPKGKMAAALAPVDTTDLYRSLNRIRGGMASWYGPGFHGRRTANGERFNQYAMTAAHKTLPFGTRVKVTNLRTGQSVIVRINDRGPYAHGRVIDLSKGAAQAIGLHSSGVGQVALDIVR